MGAIKAWSKSGRAIRCLESWLQQVVKSGGFATVDVAVKVINLEGSINKTTICNTGRSTEQAGSK